jgi:alanine racemase
MKTDHSSAPVRAWAEVNLGNISHNVRQIARLVRSAEVLAVVKADGYGHGAAAAARAALAGGASRLAVATPHEAAELRAAGVRAPVQVLGALLPGQEKMLLALGGTATLSSLAEARRLAAAARATGCRAKAHLKIDTGMHRLGARREEAEAIARFLAGRPEIRFEGAMTHLAAAGSRPDFTRGQLAAFADFVAWMRRLSICPPVLHAANSAALALHPESRLDLVRPGLAIYGIADPPGLSRRLDLRPALRLAAHILEVKTVLPGETAGYECTWRARRKSRLAIAGIGYADGIRVGLSNRGSALVRGRRVKIVGRVSMDYTALDVTGMPDVRPGDAAVFIGRSGRRTISAADVARLLGTIPYEIVCGLSHRVVKVYR